MPDPDSPALLALDDPRLDLADPSVATVVTWAREFLAAPHPDLGRTGNVCPFVGAALEKSSIFIAAHPGDPEIEEAIALMRAYRAQFAQLAQDAGRERVFLAVLVVFGDLAPSRYAEFIEGIQQRLKPEFMSEGHMIGEFHPGPPDRPGLWNPDFRPFHAPVPILAIRHMVAADVPFVTDSNVHLDLYLARFGAEVPRHLARRIAASQEGSS
ncbi:DUF6875 domain-containing protein [Nocardioides sp. GXZ039]|uniref:DUF6875 domain-containing protein n=1 Tax=Nocardioides sp. GXZ039 TaxID=3136018 RepID=UPI0030F3CFC3